MTTLSTSSLKICGSKNGKGCGKFLPLERFYRENSKSGVRAQCKDCCNKSAKAWAENNREKINASNRASRSLRKQRDPEKYREQAKNHQLKKCYGISLKQYNELIMTQCGQCAVCDDIPNTLYVHHDHTTKEVVSLLCNKCNIGIGMLKDSAKLLKRAAEIQEGR